MKGQTRIVAFDDGRFEFRQGTVPLVGIVARLPSYVEGAIVTSCTVDGRDASAAVSDAVNRSRLKEQMRAILLDGIACGGFNIFDLDYIHEATSLPVLTVTRRHPDLESMDSALRKYFQDWKERCELIRMHETVRVETEKWKLSVSCAGIDIEHAVKLLDAAIVRGNYPEPLRLAHIFAGALTMGESRGKP